jgi:hypothetical protein
VAGLGIGERDLRVYEVGRAAQDLMHRRKHRHI